MAPVPRVARERRPDPTPQPGRHLVDTGTAELLADADRYGGWLLTLDGTPQSYVDLLDPTHLEFDYVARLADLVDALWAPGRPLRAVHLGAGAATLPRWVEATRPGSRQLVVEHDAALVALVRAELGLPRGPAVRVRIGDARRELATLPPGSADLVVLDVYEGGAVPASLASREAAALALRVLRPGGALLSNVADRPPLAFTRGQVATLLSAARAASAVGDLLAVAAPGVLAGRRPGNVVLAASLEALPVAAVRARVAGTPLPARVVHGPALVSFSGGAAVVRDGTAAPGPSIGSHR